MFGASKYSKKHEDECLLRLTPEQCQMLSDFIEKYKHEGKSELTKRLVEDIQTTLQYFF